MTKYRELILPDDADGVKFAKEVCRVFVGSGDSFVSLDSEMFEGKIDHWGFVLADIARHVANMVAMNTGMTNEEVFREIENGYSIRMAAKSNVVGRILGARH